MLACVLPTVSLELVKDAQRDLTNWNLLAEVIPITADVSLHHLAAHHMAILIAISLEQSLLLLSNWRVISFIETVLDEIYNLLTLLFRENSFGKAGIEKASKSHRMMRLRIGRVESWEVDIIGKIWGVILGLGVRVAKRVVSKFLA
jgi:hypothetical protein